MSKKSLTEETVDGIAWQSLAVVANIMLRALIIILLTRNLAAVDFGIIAAATVIVSVARVFSEIGVAQALVQRLTISDEHIKSAFAIAMYTGLAAAIAIFLSAPLFEYLLKMEGLDTFVRFVSLVLVLNGLGVVAAALLQRERRFKAISLVETGSFVIGFGFVALPLAKAGFGPWSLAIAYVVQSLLKTTALTAMRPPAIGLWPNRQAAGELLQVGGGFTTGQVGNFLATQVDYLIVGRWLGAEALGFYNRAYQLLMLPAHLFGTAVGSVLFPSVAAIQGQPDRIARAYMRAMGVVALLALPVSGLLVVLAPEIIRFVLGSEWEGMIVPFQILIATLLFRTNYKISDSITVAMGSMYERAWRQWIYAAAVAAGAFIGTFWGLAGVAVGVGLAVVLNFVMMTQLALKITGIPAMPLFLLHARQLAVASLIVAPAWLAADAVRDLDIGSTAVLSAGTLAAMLAAAVLLVRIRYIFGEDGVWLRDLAASKLLVALRKRPGETS